MASPIKRNKPATGKKTTGKKKSKSGGGRTGSFTLAWFLGMIKKNALPALAAVAVVAFARAMFPGKPGEKFNLTATAVSAIIPIIAGKILKKKLTADMIERTITWAIALNFIWDGAKETLLSIGILKPIIENATKLGNKAQIGKDKTQTGSQGINRDRGTGRMPNQRAAAANLATRGTGDVMQGYIGPEVTSDVINFQLN